MRLLALILFLQVFCFPAIAQTKYSERLYKAHDSYREKTITQRRFKHHQIQSIILNHQADSLFAIAEIGRSVENRAIYSVKIGHGDIPVLLWSQMHGDEPTATMAIMDIFNFFKASDEFDPFREMILDRLTLYFIPMLNPDGAEKYQRRNALGIDLNRDARRLQSPESVLLKSMREKTQAKFGFNLHDQGIHYAAGYNPTPATITFLAPAYNQQEDINEVRANAMKVIVQLEQMLQQYIPNGIGKWNDDFEPRAFGELMTKWGTSTILIESGGYPGDPEKQYIRKLNFVTLLTAFEIIATQQYEKESIERYFQIPKNERILYDLMIRNIKIHDQDRSYLIDVGIRLFEQQYGRATKYFHTSGIQDVGDLSTFFGYKEFDAQGYEWVDGASYPKRFKDLQHFLKKHTAEDLLS